MDSKTISNVFDKDGFDRDGHHMDDIDLTDIEEIEKEKIEHELRKKRKRRKVIKPTLSITPYTIYISKIPSNDAHRD